MQALEPEYPLEFDSIKCAPMTANKIAVTLEGHWRGRHRPSVARAMLVVESEGGRHAVPAVTQTRRKLIGRSRSWYGEFQLPAWLEPSLEGNTSLALGDLSIPLPAGAFDRAGPARAGSPGSDPRSHGELPSEPEDNIPESDPWAKVDPEPPGTVTTNVRSDAPEPHPDAAHPDAAQPDATQTDAVHTAAALRAELERRAASEAAVRGELAQVHAELQAQAGNQARLKQTHDKLRAELEALREAVERLGDVQSRAVLLAARVDELEAELEAANADRKLQAGELATLRGEIASSTVSREAALSEAVGLHGELDRLGAELAAARQSSAPSGELGEAEALLAEARALRAKMGERAAARAAGTSSH